MNEIWNVVMQSANLAAGLGACASALATFYTVLEMRKQLKNQFAVCPACNI